MRFGIGLMFFVISHSHSVGVKVKAIEAISRGKILVCCKEVLVGLPKELHNYCYIMDKEKQILDAIKEIENKGLKILNSKRNEANKILENISPKNKLKKIIIEIFKKYKLSKSTFCNLCRSDN